MNGSRSAGAFGVRRLPALSPMAYGPPMAMLPTMLEEDRERADWSVGQGRGASVSAHGWP